MSSLIYHSHSNQTLTMIICCILVFIVEPFLSVCFYIVCKFTSQGSHIVGRIKLRVIFLHDGLGKRYLVFITYKDNNLTAIIRHVLSENTLNWVLICLKIKSLPQKRSGSAVSGEVVFNVFHSVDRLNVAEGMNVSVLNSVG